MFYNFNILCFLLKYNDLKKDNIDKKYYIYTQLQ